MSEFINTRISERKFYRIEPINLAADGTEDGLVTVPNTYCFKVGQKVTLRSDTLQPRVYKVKKVLSETQLHVGEEKRPISEYADITDFTTADNAVIVLPEQNRPAIDPVDIQGMVFEEEPTVALRTHAVDWLGRSYDVSNPIPVQLSDGNIDIGTVNAELEVQLSHQDNVPDVGDVADSVQVGDGDNILDINPDGSINVVNKSDIVSTGKVVHVPIPAANTEYSYTFTTDTKRFKFKIQSPRVKTLIAYDVGTTGTAGWTVRYGNTYEENKLDDTSRTIYFQASKANQVAEILYWE